MAELRQIFKTIYFQTQGELDITRAVSGACVVCSVCVYPSIYTHYYIKHFQLLSHVITNNGWIENKPRKNIFLAKYERFLLVKP